MLLYNRYITLTCFAILAPAAFAQVPMNAPGFGNPGDGTSPLTNAVGPGGAGIHGLPDPNAGGIGASAQPGGIMNSAPGVGIGATAQPGGIMNSAPGVGIGSPAASPGFSDPNAGMGTTPAQLPAGMGVPPASTPGNLGEAGLPSINTGTPASGLSAVSAGLNAPSSDAGSGLGASAPVSPGTSTNGGPPAGGAPPSTPPAASTLDNPSQCMAVCALAGLDTAKNMSIAQPCGDNRLAAAFKQCLGGEKCLEGDAISWQTVCTRAQADMSRFTVNPRPSVASPAVPAETAPGTTKIPGTDREKNTKDNDKNAAPQLQSVIWLTFITIILTLLIC